MNDSSDFDSEKTKEELKSELQKTEEEKEKLKKRVSDLDRELSHLKSVKSKKWGDLSEILEEWDDFSADDGIYIEEIGASEDLKFAVVYWGGGEGMEIVQVHVRGRGFPPSLSVFIEEEFDVFRYHKHEFGSRHRIWKIQGKDFEILKRFSKLNLGHIFSKNGWSGLNKRLEKTIKAYENPLGSDLSFFEGRSGHIVNEKAGKLKNRLLRYSYRNEISPDKAAFVLLFEDDEFREDYEELKKKIKSREEDLRVILEWKDNK